MSILIKDMEMPKNCDECDIHVCKLWLRMTIGQRSKGKHPSCQLVKIPTPHGKLIDADKLNIHDVSPAYGFCVMGVTEEDIELADTVIEAEGSEE